MSESIIRVDHLGKRYLLGQRQRVFGLRHVLGNFVRRPWSIFRREPREYLWALEDVSLEVLAGETIGLIGRNGAGKTTLLKILSRITRPTTGYADVHGRVGSLLEVGTGFHPELTGRENVYLSGAILGMRRREIGRKFDEIVAFADVERFLDTALKYFSSGMQVRLAFAVAAHLEPEILLVDEVLAVGDLKFQKKCMGKMSEVASGGRTIIFVSHQMNQIRRLCKRIFWIDAGGIREEGPMAKVVSAYETAMSSGEWAAPIRPNSPKVKGRFQGWRIVESGERDPNVMDWQGPVTFAFDVEIFQPLRACHHGITLYDLEGRLLWGTAVNGLDLLPGKQQFVYAFPNLPLQPGTYTWRLSLYDENSTIDVCFCIPQLLVATEPLTHPMDEWAGVLNIPAGFEVQENPCTLEPTEGD